MAVRTSRVNLCRGEVSEFRFSQMQGTQRKMMFSVSFYNIISIIKMALDSSSLNECLNHEIRHESLSHFWTVHSFTFIKFTQSQTETLLNIANVELGLTQPAALARAHGKQLQGKLSSALGLFMGPLPGSQQENRGLWIWLVLFLS